jgi:hypothetical protein
MVRASVARAADRQPFDQQGRLANTRRHALPALAAHADAFVEFAISLPMPTTRVSALGPSPISVAPLIGAPILPFFDAIGLGAGKDELARHDIHLPAAEAFGENAVLDAGQQLRRIVLARLS